MAKLNFNAINRPTLELIMQDKAQTVITVTTPSEKLVEELQETLPELQNILGAGGEESTEAAYDLAARLMSYNKEGLTVTVEDLQTKYWPVNKMENLVNMLVFIKAYAEFIEEINNAKN